MKIKNYWMALAIALVSLCTISCGGDDDDEGGTKNDPVTVADPEGTIVANLTNTFIYTKNGYYKNGISNMNGIDYGYLGMNSSNNLQAESGWYNNYEVKMVSIGKVNGLSSINVIPKDGWTNQVAAIPGYGYIYRSEYVYTPGIYTYARIYAVDYMTSTSGGIMGITIKYQEKWEPNTK